MSAAEKGVSLRADKFEPCDGCGENRAKLYVCPDCGLFKCAESCCAGSGVACFECEEEACEDEESDDE